MRRALLAFAAALLALGVAAPGAQAADDAGTPHVVCRFSDPRLVEIESVAEAAAVGLVPRTQLPLV